MQQEWIRQYLAADLERRLKVLPEEVAAWKQSALANVAQLGLHGSQLVALSDMMGVLAADQAAELEKLRALDDPRAFGDGLQALLSKLGGAHDVWRIFRTILNQRQDPTLTPLADTADLIAHDGYASCLEQARRWGIVEADHFREPPLTYLESSLSPSTASRGENVQLLGFPVREYRNLMLPVPIVLFPLDQAASFWMMCSIAHEVGHNVDHDLDPRPNRRLTDEYKKKLIGRVPDGREPQWRRWMAEIFADAIAVVFGGAGFGFSMAFWTVPLGQATEFQAPAPSAVHPPPLLRLRLIAEMLRETGIAEIRSAGDVLVDLWGALARPAWEADYEADVPTLATLLMGEAVALNGRALLALNRGLAADHDRSAELAAHWADARKPRPHPIVPDAFPFRLVPSAAALGTSMLGDPDAAALDGLHAKAAGYFKLIPRPAKLAGAGDRHRDYLKELAGRLDFSRPGQTEEDEP
jgi:hypothetical protein